jgi:hypothetical protein
MAAQIFKLSRASRFVVFFVSLYMKERQLLSKKNFCSFASFLFFCFGIDTGLAVRGTSSPGCVVASVFVQQGQSSSWHFWFLVPAAGAGRCW